MIVSFSFAYNQHLPKAQRVELAKVVGREIELDDDGDPKTYSKYTGPVGEILQAINGTAKIEIEGITEPAPLVQIGEQLARLQVAPDGSVAPAADAEPDTYVNNKIDVHVPGLGLLAIGDVLLEEDCCTDHLREQLAAGWRIVAVCPQPDQRRPDYILGRTAPTE